MGRSSESAIRRDDLVEDLKSVRRGLGFASPDLAERIGPGLRAVAGIGPNEGAGAVKVKATRVVRDWVQGMSDVDRMILGIAFNLDPVFDARLTARIEVIAKRIDRDPRTAIRRVDDAIVRLAELAFSKRVRAASEEPGLDWHVAGLEVLLLLDRGSPEVFERRTIVSEQDDLRSVRIGTSVPRVSQAGASAHGLRTDVSFGGVLRERRRRGAATFDTILGLPRPLMRGQSHTFEIVHRFPDGQPMRPHYALIPSRIVKSFVLRGRFPAHKRLRELRRIDGAYPREIDDPTPDERSLDLDDASEVVVRFDNPRPGLAHGMRWRWA